MGLSVLSAVVLASLDVDWRAPETCPAPDLSLIAASANGSARAIVTQPSRATWVLELDFLEPFQASRRLELSSCTDVRRAARALLVLGLKGAEAFNAAPVPPPTPPPLTKSDVQPVATPPEPSPRFALRLGALAQALSTPAVTPRLALEGGVGTGPFDVSLMVRAGLPAQYQAGPTATSAVSIWPALGGELLGCFTPNPDRPVRPSFCGGALAEWWQLRGVGVSDPLAGSAPLLGAGAQVRLTVEVGTWLELTAFLSARAHLLRPVARFGGVDALSAGPFSLEAGALAGFSRP